MCDISHSHDTGGGPDLAAVTLRAHRRTLTAAWERFHARGSADGVRAEVVESWDRSRTQLPQPVDAAPLDPQEQVREAWRNSALRPALATVADDLERTALDCDLVAAVTDASGRILWSAGSRHMRDRASAVNFVPGGRWDEASVGTNALDLALRSARPAQVFSAEHFSPAVHGWVCYAAPLVDGRDGRVLGVLDLSTTWDRSHPMALATVTAFARTVSQALGAHARAPRAVLERAHAPLRLEVLGRARLWQGDAAVMLTQRQAELLLALACHPEGLSLDQLAAHVYGDVAVTMTTVKVEVSRLRRVVPGVIGSRPYRLDAPVMVDALDVLDMVAGGAALAAAQACRAEVMPGSESPLARALGLRMEVAVRSLVLASRDPAALAALAANRPDDLEVVDHALRLAPHRSPGRALLEAGRAVARSD